MTFFLIASHVVPQHQLDRMRLQIDLVGQIRHPAAPDVMGEQQRAAKRAVSGRYAKMRSTKFSRSLGSLSRPSSSTGSREKRVTKASANSPRPDFTGIPAVPYTLTRSSPHVGESFFNTKPTSASSTSSSTRRRG
jgi:hypothetical protein